MLREAHDVDHKAFLRLICQVDQILSSEKEKIQIVGRLVYLSPKGKIIVVGDIHGDLDSLEQILNEIKICEVSFGTDTYLVFLGDYGDRGPFSPEVYYIVLSLKKMFPENVVLLQGNHEGPQDLLASPHDLPHHLFRKFSTEWQTVYLNLSSLFRSFYTAVLVKGKFIMLHGGVPSKAKTADDVAFAYKKHPFETHLEEILWSDPAEGIKGTRFSPRGAGYLFGEDVTDIFLKVVNAKCVVRGHEPTDEGYKINHGGKVITIFSRKGLPYNNNKGAYIIIDNNKVDSASYFSSCIQQF
ncbi:serine/threonine protein phosphatase [Candidatus Bathyarchaeota archaeon]|nr:serine/threonine protein phosphatase [Candidatus Bathyarchaeota archaeon]